MNNTAMPEKTAHHGKNVKRLREILHVKQEALADALGMSQQNISLLEQKEKIDKEQMKVIAEVLKVPVEAIENYNEDEAVNIITNYFTSNDTSTLHGSPINTANQCTFNPLDEMLKLVEENKKLYERLVQAEKDKVALLEKMVGK